MWWADLSQQLSDTQWLTHSSNPSRIECSENLISFSASLIKAIFYSDHKMEGIVMLVYPQVFVESLKQ